MMYESVDARNYEPKEQMNCMAVNHQPEWTVRETCQHTRAVLCDLIGQERVILSFLHGGEKEKSEPTADPTCFVEDVNSQNTMAERALMMMQQIREILGAE